MPRNGSDIAVVIRELAKARGVTVKQTLEDCRINRNFLYDLERGNSSPSVDKLARIAEYFGVSASKLLDAESDDISRLIDLYKRLSPRARAELFGYMEGLIE